MTEKPILFSGPMVRAVLEGRKTQTRRKVRFQPNGEPYNASCHNGKWLNYACNEVIATCPYGKDGDRLWVRETFAVIDNSDFGEGVYYQYRADTDGKCLAGNWPDDEADNPDRPLWKPSIFMPRMASRITLEVTEIRVQRLQEITDEDAIAEGATAKPNASEDHAEDFCYSMDWPEREPPEGWAYGSHADPRYAFARFINRLHGGKRWNLKPTNLWDENPWIWAVSFRRVLP